MHRVAREAGDGHSIGDVSAPAGPPPSPPRCVKCLSRSRLFQSTNCPTPCGSHSDLTCACSGSS
eukprot:12916389-Prorocentrum_lima.AAC.1